MKILRSILILTLAFVATLAIVGCNTTQQTIAADTISGIETTSTQGYEAYIALVLQGQVSTNDVPKISHIYNQLQADVILATVAVQNNTNALAPTNLVTESTLLLNAISVAKTIK